MKTRKTLVRLALVLVLALGIREFFVLYGVPFRREVPLETIERMVDTRDPKTISGSFWKQGMDCTFKNPPPELTMQTLSGCASETHRASVMRNARDHYFVPYNQMKDAPPYCLMNYPQSRLLAVDTSRQRQRMYCRQPWSIVERLLFEAGAL